MLQNYTQKGLNRQSHFDLHYKAISAHAGRCRQEWRRCLQLQCRHKLSVRETWDVGRGSTNVGWWNTTPILQNYTPKGLNRQSHFDLRGMPAEHKRGMLAEHKRGVVKSCSLFIATTTSTLHVVFLLKIHSSPELLSLLLSWPIVLLFCRMYCFLIVGWCNSGHCCWTLAVFVLFLECSFQIQTKHDTIKHGAKMFILVSVILYSEGEDEKFLFYCHSS